VTAGKQTGRSKEGGTARCPRNRLKLTLLMVLPWLKGGWTAPSGSQRSRSGWETKKERQSRRIGCILAAPRRPKWKSAVICFASIVGRRMREKITIALAILIALHEAYELVRGASSDVGAMFLMMIVFLCLLVWDQMKDRGKEFIREHEEALDAKTRLPFGIAESVPYLLSEEQLRSVSQSVVARVKGSFPPEQKYRYEQSWDDLGFDVRRGSSRLRCKVSQLTPTVEHTLELNPRAHLLSVDAIRESVAYNRFKVTSCIVLMIIAAVYSLADPAQATNGLTEANLESVRDLTMALFILVAMVSFMLWPIFHLIARHKTSRWFPVAILLNLRDELYKDAQGWLRSLESGAQVEAADVRKTQSIGSSVP